MRHALSRAIGGLLAAAVLPTLAAGCSSNGGAPTSEPAPVPPPERPEQLALYVQSGGIAGFDTRISVDTDGTVRVSRRGEERTGTLSPAELSKLTTLAGSVSPFSTIKSTPDDPRATDRMTEGAVLYGTGRKLADQRQRRALSTMLKALEETPDGPLGR